MLSKDQQYFKMMEMLNSSDKVCKTWYFLFSLIVILGSVIGFTFISTSNIYRVIIRDAIYFFAALNVHLLIWMAFGESILNERISKQYYAIYMEGKEPEEKKYLLNEELLKMIAKAQNFTLSALVYCSLIFIWLA